MFQIVELLIFKSALTSIPEMLRYLLLVEVLIAECLQTNLFSGGMFYGLWRLMTTKDKLCLKKTDQQEIDALDFS